VLEGRFEFLHEDARIEADQGSLVYVPKGNMHAFENAGETTGKLLVSQTPGGAYEGFVDEVGEASTGEGRLQATAGSPNNAEKLAAVGALYGVETVPPLPQRKPWRARRDS
jgi:glyoxylate utilization-related uncharacterized protein